MCGLVGRIWRGNNSDGPARAAIESAVEHLRGRGPDSWRAWRLPDGRVELLHTRLAVVDPDPRATQPFEEGRFVVVLNGEVYNYAELRAELRGHVFRTESDTEVLLALFAHSGVVGLRRLRGMFACAIVDRVEQRVYLIRDPIGKKPLYLRQDAHGVSFGSSVLALIAVGDRPGEVDAELIEPYWRDQYIPADKSVVRHCRPLAPGEVLVLDFDGRTLAREDCTPPDEAEGHGSLVENRRRCEGLLREAVQRRLHNNPAPVSLLSGGVDSTVITRHMQAAGKGSAIGLRSLIPLGQDEKYCRYAARRLGIHLDLVGLPRRGLGAEVAWAFALQDEPLAVFSFLPLALLVRKAKEYGKILLTGDGGDEVFLGYGQTRRWVDEQGLEPSPREGNVIQVGGPAPAWMSAWGRSTSNDVLLGHMLPKLDRATAEQGVEARCPLLDWDVLRFARRLPPEQLFFSGSSKAMLKAELDDWGRWFVERRKLGFAYHLRWLWAMDRFDGLREMIRPDSIERFAGWVPLELAGEPGNWSTRAILGNFDSAWKLLAWSRFQERLERVNGSLEP